MSARGYALHNVNAPNIPFLPFSGRNNYDEIARERTNDRFAFRDSSCRQDDTTQQPSFLGQSGHRQTA